MRRLSEGRHASQGFLPSVMLPVLAVGIMCSGGRWCLRLDNVDKTIKVLLRSYQCALNFLLLYADIFLCYHFLGHFNGKILELSLET